MLGRSNKFNEQAHMKLLNILIKFIRLINGYCFCVVKFLMQDLIWPPTKQTLIYGMPAAALFTIFQLIIINDQIKSLGIYVLTPLAVLIAFTGLIYARARARAVDGDDQKICISSADQAFKACIYYSLALVWGFVMATWGMMLKGSNLELPKDGLYIFLYP
ncbi:MAG: hypothetical protein CTY38_03990 [Methylotenera sp.]|nr:MAG: hypothetical protein CTY38_03990 [Methylotenera sp.]